MLSLIVDKFEYAEFSVMFTFSVFDGKYLGKFCPKIQNCI